MKQLEENIRTLVVEYSNSRERLTMEAEDYREHYFSSVRDKEHRERLIKEEFGVDNVTQAFAKLYIYEAGKKQIAKELKQTKHLLNHERVNSEKNQKHINDLTTNIREVKALYSEMITCLHINSSKKQILFKLFKEEDYKKISTLLSELLMKIHPKSPEKRPSVPAKSRSSRSPTKTSPTRKPQNEAVPSNNPPKLRHSIIQMKEKRTDSVPKQRTRTSSKSLKDIPIQPIQKASQNQSIEITKSKHTIRQAENIGIYSPNTHKGLSDKQMQTPPVHPHKTLSYLTRIILTHLILPQLKFPRESAALPSPSTFSCPAPSNYKLSRISKQLTVHKHISLFYDPTSQDLSRSQTIPRNRTLQYAWKLRALHFFIIIEDYIEEALALSLSSHIPYTSAMQKLLQLKLKASSKDTIISYLQSRISCKEELQVISALITRTHKYELLNRIWNTPPDLPFSLWKTGLISETTLSNWTHLARTLLTKQQAKTSSLPPSHISPSDIRHLHQTPCKPWTRTSHLRPIKRHEYKLPF